MRVFTALVVAAAFTAAVADEGTVTTSDGVHLYYRSVGRGNDIVVIPVAVWTSPYFDRLANDSRRIIYYDPRGRGRSETGDLAAATVDRATRDLDELLTQVGVEKAALIGWSGYGLEMAVFALAHPARVTRLVQLNPVPPRQEPYMSRRSAAIRERVDIQAWRQYQAMAAEGGASAASCRQFNRATAPAFLVHPERAYETIDRLCESASEWPPNQEKFFAAFLPSIAQLDLRPRIEELRMPRLVVHGTRDLIPADGVREWLVPASPNAKLLLIEGADHASFIDAPDQVIGAIDSFLAGQWPNGARQLSR